MQTTTLSLQFLQKRKFFLVLPLLVLPFITVIFWALGGGKGNDAQAQQTTAKEGLNVELPEASLKDDKSLDKLSYYQKAASDSAKLEELMKNDPYYRKHHQETEGVYTTNDTSLPSVPYKNNSKPEKNSLNTSAYSNRAYTDTNEAKVYKKLNELNTALNQATVQSDKAASYSDVSRSNTTSINSADIYRLEQMMDMTKNGDGSEDPEMKQLNGMMEKILDIQHPERVKEKVKQISNANEGQVFAVTATNNNDNTSLLVSNSSLLSNDTFRYKSPGNGFFSLNNEDVEDNTEQQNTIQAVIHETQTLVEGAVVKLRLINDVYINGTLIPKNNFVFGTASLNAERLNIKISSIRYKNALFPVQLSVVDIDGIEGVYVPGVITRDVAKSSAERAVQGIGFTTLDPSPGAQAASAGIEAAKTLLSKKARLIKVTVKADYQVLLRDEKQKVSS